MSERRVVALGSYTGRAVLTVPGADTVILAAVTWARALHEALSTRADRPGSNSRTPKARWTCGSAISPRPDGGW
ncbi:hypothetical protein [Streptomyces murinus]|uniref:hypothetical protein n=1 Tax=Streptomyces murinus TaxID=33900 RepID=UPI002E11801B|nr:hypothetical protein OG516_11380 [Streptomyces murinus]